MLAAPTGSQDQAARRKPLLVRRERQTRPSSKVVSKKGAPGSALLRFVAFCAWMLSGMVGGSGKTLCCQAADTELVDNIPVPLEQSVASVVVHVTICAYCQQVLHLVGSQEAVWPNRALQYYLLIRSAKSLENLSGASAGCELLQAPPALPLRKPRRRIQWPSTAEKWTGCLPRKN